MVGNKVISEILAKEGLNAKQFAEIIGVTPTQVYDLKNGKVKRISDKFAEKILDKFSKYSKTWLMTGDGEMFSNPDSFNDKVAGRSNTTLDEKKNDLDFPDYKQLFEIIRLLSETVNSQQRTIEELQKQLRKEAVPPENNAGCADAG